MASSAAGRGGGAHKSAGEEASRGEILYQKSSPQPWEWKKCVKVPAAASDKDPVQGKEAMKGLGRSSEKAEEKQGKGRSCWGIEEEEKKEQLNSSSMGLKLGKRTYFEDGHEDCSSKMSSVQATSAPNAAEAAGPATTSTTTTTPTKKGRGSSQTAVTPKCQVEGCKADLSGSKDYHRRHKVCEVHSKTPKNMVNGSEQRFCQQCSRFHLLSEFDEGKRSCRRRLAGHNERRRKPQPDALAAYNMGNVSSFQAAYQRLGVGSSLLMDSHAEALGYGASTTNSWRYGSHHPQFLSKQLVENLSAEKLLLLLQNSKRSTGLPTISASTTNATATTTTTANNMAKQDQMKLTLSSSPGGGGGLNSAGESSRALSLLSSDAWTKSATPGYELTSSTTSTQQTATNNNTSQYLLTTTAASPAAVESKKPVHHHHQRPHHHHQAQDAIPISSSSSKVAHHQQQQQTYASPLGSSGCWKFSGSSSSGY